MRYPAYSNSPNSKQEEAATHISHDTALHACRVLHSRNAADRDECAGYSSRGLPWPPASVVSVTASRCRVSRSYAAARCMESSSLAEPLAAAFARGFPFPLMIYAAPLYLIQPNLFCTLRKTAVIQKMKAQMRLVAYDRPNIHMIREVSTSSRR